MLDGSLAARARRARRASSSTLDRAAARPLRLAAVPRAACSCATTRRCTRRGSRSACATRVIAARRARVRALARARAARAARDVVAETEGGSVRAGAAVLAVNAADARRARRCATASPVTSSHIVLTEPVPDVLEQLGWTGGESITDARTFVHYFRTTNDGRIVFGWGGGPLAFGARLTAASSSTPLAVERTARTCASSSRSSPAARSRTPGAARSTSPRATSRRSARWTARPSTTRSASPATASARAPRRPDPRRAAPPARRRVAARGRPAAAVPPEPLAWAGGMLVRAAFLRKERIEAEGRRPDPLTRAVCAAPKALGIHVSR